MGCNNLWKQCLSGRHHLIYANEIVRYWSHLCIPYCGWEISCPFISDTRGIEDKGNATIISGFDLCWLHQTSIDSPDKYLGKIRWSLFWNANGKFTPFTFQFRHSFVFKFAKIDEGTWFGYLNPVHLTTPIVILPFLLAYTTKMIDLGLWCLHWFFLFVACYQMWCINEN